MFACSLLSERLFDVQDILPHIALRFLAVSLVVIFGPGKDVDLSNRSSLTMGVATISLQAGS